jgi:hypothetical protein
VRFLTKRSRYRHGGSKRRSDGTLAEEFASAAARSAVAIKIAKRAAKAG